MSGFINFVSASPSGSADPSVVAQASTCLDRFTAAFNACNLAAMDAELNFPHIMLSGSERLVWERPGQHPSDVFANPAQRELVLPAIRVTGPCARRR